MPTLRCSQLVTMMGNDRGCDDMASRHGARPLPREGLLKRNGLIAYYGCAFSGCFPSRPHLTSLDCIVLAAAAAPAPATRVRPFRPPALFASAAPLEPMAIAPTATALRDDMHTV